VQYRLKVLTDNQHFFPIYQGAALMRQDFAKKNPKITRALNRLAGKISNEDMQNMNYAVNVKHQSPATVAKKYLKTHNILK
ncbi:MAG: glycine betaine ABC transporter substrate-binding protein, partial [Leuconostoc falkenbergense]